MSMVDRRIQDGIVTIDGHDSLPRLFRARVAQWGDRIAMREKELGVWKAHSWNDFSAAAHKLGAGLLEEGFQKSDVAAILSETNKEWVFADMGILLAGGVVNGVYPTYQPDQLEYTLTDSGASILFVENEEQLDKYLEVRDRLPLVRRVYVFDWTGLREFEDPVVRPLDDLYQAGATALHRDPAILDDRIATTVATDTAVLIYTSGTTGRPKGACVPHQYLLFQMGNAPDPIPITGDDETLTYLPLCHAAERILSLCMNLAHGHVIHFAESPETVFQNIKELSPTFLFAVPRIWEKMYSRLSSAMAEATWAGRAGYALAMKIGHRRAAHVVNGTTPSAGLRLAAWMADRLVFQNVKLLLGLDRARFLLSGAAPISPDLIRWFLALGLPMTEVYGQTETGLATMTRRGEFRPGTVGHAGPGVEVRLGEGQEIQVRSPGMFAGYLNLPQATAETLVDGWVRTGDVGEWDESGSLRITDRLKDIIITSGGKNITPSQIENQLKFSPYIADAIVIGDARKYLTCLIMIDQENVETYAQRAQIPFTNYKSLCARPEITALIEAEVKQANTRFSSVEQVKAFRLIDVLLNPEDEELTPTMKLKRSLVIRKYAELIDTMY